jgi:hypothetical protein
MSYWQSRARISIDNRAVDELCTIREVRLRLQKLDYPRPVDCAVALR